MRKFKNGKNQIIICVDDKLKRHIKSSCADRGETMTAFLKELIAENMTLKQPGQLIKQDEI